jgi:hypothetical protein
VDLFQDGRWRHTATLPRCEQPAALPFALPAGLLRLQLRRDPFGSESAAVLSLYARTAHESAADVLDALASSALRIDPDDALARALREADGAIADDDFASASGSANAALEGPHALARDYLLALHDEGLFDPPRAASSLPRAQLELAAESARHRKLGLLVLALCAVALVALVAERGLSSSTQARSLLAAAGSDAAVQQRQRLRSVLSLVSVVAALLLVFALVAVYVIVRGRGTLGP